MPSLVYGAPLYPGLLAKISFTFKNLQHLLAAKEREREKEEGMRFCMRSCQEGRVQSVIFVRAFVVRGAREFYKAHAFPCPIHSRRVFRRGRERLKCPDDINHVASGHREGRLR